MAASTAIDPALVARFKEALERLNPKGRKIGLAVSGGPDSMAMLLLAQEAIPGQFEVATVDHGLRPEAKDECALVVAACEERGVPCEVLTVTVGEGNVQAKAREARYEALADWATLSDFLTVATAHHMDDQIETLFMRINRGSGIEGLASIREEKVITGPVGITPLIRPLLRFRRSELSAVIKSANIAVVYDPSNEDESFDRVRIRHALAAVDWINVEAAAKSARLIGETVAAIEDATITALTTRVRHSGEEWRFRPTGMRLVDQNVVKMLMSAAKATVRGGAIAALVQRLLRCENGNLGGLLATVEGDEWVFRPEPPRKTG